MFKDPGKFLAVVADNAMFLLMCLVVFAGIFGIALLLEKLWLKPEKQSPAGWPMWASSPPSLPC